MWIAAGLSDHGVAALFASGVVAVPVGGMFVEVGSSCGFGDFAHITPLQAFWEGNSGVFGFVELASFVSAGLVTEVGLVGCCFGAGDAVAV